MSHAIVQALLAHYDSVYAGPNGDYATVLESLAGLTAAQALWKPACGQNSIWQIVEHLIASKEWQIEMLERGQAASPVWGEPSGDDVMWQATLARLQAAHQRQKAALEKVADADLLGAQAAEGGRTLLELLISSGPAHEAHHAGQIDYLKGLQAAG